MRSLLPQEIEAWYLIPAVRKELAKIFITKYKLNQREIAKILGVTEAAVSQYTKSKRGNEILFSKKNLLIIEKTASKIFKNKKDSIKIIYKTCGKLRNSKAMCEVHMSMDKGISKKCDICFN